MRRAIGKGLSQLLAVETDDKVSEVPISSVVPNNRQPRRRFDEASLKELASSISEYGLIQPIVVRALEGGKYELIAGERRLRASKLAGLKSVPVSIRIVNDESSLEMALVENIQREDINALDCALAYRQLADEFGLTQEQIAQKVGKSRVAITNTLRLLKLPQRVLQALSNGEISEGHARALLGFENELHMMAVFDQILSQGLSVKDVEQRAKTEIKSASKKVRPASPEDPNRTALEDVLSTHFGSPAKIRPAKVGGELSIQYFSDDDLQRILELLGLA